MTTAGVLRHRVTIQQVTTTRNEYGEEISGDPVVVATVWAAVEPLRGREFFDAQQVHAEVTTRIRIRYREGITPAMQVVWGNHTYEIIAPPIDVGGRHRELHLMCRELVPGT